MVDSIFKLKSENFSLKERLTTMQTFINRLLDEKIMQENPGYPQVSRIGQTKVVQKDNTQTKQV